MNRLRRPQSGAVQFDLEEVTELLWDNEVFLLLVQIAIFAVLPQLDGMPSVRRLPAGEANARNVILLGSQKPLESVTEPLCQHLHGGGRNVFALPLESRLQVILAWKRTLVLILLLDSLKHLIVNQARLFQALHEQVPLLLIRIQAILQGSHILYHKP